MTVDYNICPTYFQCCGDIPVGCTSLFSYVEMSIELTALRTFIGRASLFSYVENDN